MNRDEIIDSIGYLLYTNADKAQLSREESARLARLVMDELDDIGYDGSLTKYQGYR